MRCAAGWMRAADAGGGVRAGHGRGRRGWPELSGGVEGGGRGGGLHAVAAACDADESLFQSLERAHRDAPRVRNWLVGEETSARVR